MDNIYVDFLTITFALIVPLPPVFGIQHLQKQCHMVSSPSVIVASWFFIVEKIRHLILRNWKIFIYGDIYLRD